MRNLWPMLAVFAIGAGPGASEAQESALATPVTQEETKAEPEEDAEEAERFSVRRIDFGVQGPETDTSSSRFREYRPLPGGVVLHSLHFAGDDRFRYDVRVDDALQSAARYRARVEPGPFAIDFDF